MDGVKQKVLNEVPKAEVEVIYLDLSVKQSVLDFCSEVITGEYSTRSSPGHQLFHILAILRPKNLNTVVFCSSFSIGLS